MKRCRVASPRWGRGIFFVGLKIFEGLMPGLLRIAMR
jgi:hypothetical protein